MSRTVCLHLAKVDRAPGSWHAALQELNKFVKERDTLERDRLQLRADNDALHHQLSECKREAEHKHIQETIALKTTYEQKYNSMATRCRLSINYGADLIMHQLGFSMCKHHALEMSCTA
jgi:hypothetical protein